VDTSRRPRTCRLSFSEHDVDSWAEAIANLHASTAHDPDEARTAYEAVANPWSGYGYQDVPTEVIRMLVNAIEIGYIARAERRPRRRPRQRDPDVAPGSGPK
jgi:hypothetical protein